ncbi:MAG TPA: sulfatase-like hydrolase/transferase [Thermoanaerobaculia bacterium]|nr:sulfatase-like hydrolase/transferase [Thermoanaerobaculia bacterium]
MRKGYAWAAVLFGLLLGLADAAVLHFNILFARWGVPEMPPTIWAVTPLVWIALTLVTAMIVRRLPIAFGLAAMLLLLFRVAVPLRRAWLAEDRFTKLFPYATELIALAVVALLMLPLLWLAHRYGPRLQDAAHRLRLALATLVVVAVVAIVVSRWPSSVERPRRTAKADAPNIVLIFLDTQRYDTSSLRNPQSHLSQLARSGVSYTRAFAPQPWTLPSHVAVVTGLPATRLPIDYERSQYAGTAPTLAETLGPRGYTTAAILANPILGARTNFERGYQIVQVSKNDHDLCRTAPFEVLGRFMKVPGCGAAGCSWTAPEVTERATALLARLPRPYFLTLNYMDAHTPYYVPRECRPAGFQPFDAVRDAQPLYRVNRTGEAVPENTLQRILRAYAAATDCVDRAMGDLFAAIRARGENTIIAVVGDHGEQFGEHAVSMHGNSVYRQVMQVPLVVAGAGVTPRGTDATPIDITALHSMLLSRTVPTGPVIGRYQSPRDRSHLAPRFHRSVWSVIAEDHHLLAYDDGGVELYALSDIAERHDLAATNAPVRERLMALAAQARAEHARHAQATGEEKLRSLPYLR